MKYGPVFFIFKSAARGLILSNQETGDLQSSIMLSGELLPTSNYSNGESNHDASPLLESTVAEDGSRLRLRHQEHGPEGGSIDSSSSPSGTTTPSISSTVLPSYASRSGSCFRSVRAVAVLSFLTSTAFIFLICLAPLTFFLLRLFSIHASRRLNSILFGHWLAMWPYLFEKVNRTKVRLVGEPEGSRVERAVVMCNHRTEVDWMYVWCLALRRGSLGHVKYVLKSSVRNVPVFGWSFHLLEFLLIHRNWQLDEHAFTSLLSTFNDPADPLWLVIFPEGTDFTEEKCLKSQKYAEEHSLPKLENILLPRTKGFYACVHQLRESIDAVYDLTVGYKHPLPLFMDNATGTNPKEVHIHVKRTPISDIPCSEADVSTWLVKQFIRKDELLAHFYKEGVFPGTPVEGELSTIAGLLNFFTILIFTCLLLWIMLIPYMWIRVYLAFSCVLLTGSTYFNYKPKPLFPRYFHC